MWLKYVDPKLTADWNSGDGCAAYRYAKRSECSNDASCQIK